MKKRLELWDAGMFPVLTGRYGSEDGVSVPLEMVLPHETQAQINHSQTLRRLAERGGLSARELAAVLSGSKAMPATDEAAWLLIFQKAARCLTPNKD